MKVCKKCGEEKPKSDFPVHYEWCYKCLNMKPRKYNSRRPPNTWFFPGDGVLCDKCFVRKPSSSFDSPEWIEKYPGFYHTTCIECRHKGKTKALIKKEQEKEARDADRIIEKIRVNDWKREKRRTLNIITSKYNLTRQELYQNKELVDLAEAYLKLKNLLKTQKQ